MICIGRLAYNRFMPLVPFSQLMADAQRQGYAVGYFESWNLESLQGVIDAAEAAASPVIVGFSGVNLPDPRRLSEERLEWYAALGKAACESTWAPAALLFNESPSFPWVLKAIEFGFNLVMFSDERLGASELRERVKATVAAAAGRAAIEAEMESLAGMAEGLDQVPETVCLTDPEAAADFVTDTRIDALAVSLGNVHLHGRHKVGLDLGRLRAIRRRVNVPLVLHGATSIDDQSLREAIGEGIGKINVGSALRSAFYNAIRDAIAQAGADFNPYEVVGSGLPQDVLTAGRRAVRDIVIEKMRLFGSAGRASA